MLSSNKKSSTRFIIIAVIFLLVAGLGYYIFNSLFAKDENLKDEQKVVYLLGMALTTSGLFVCLVQKAMEKKDEQKDTPVEYYPILSAVFSGIVILLGYAYFGMFPAGGRTIMVVDMYHQYAPLLQGMKDKLLNFDSLMYSFKDGIGTSYIPMIAYYLASPFNLILLLIPFHLLAEGILIVITLKLMLSAAFFALALQYFFKRRDMSVMITSLLYSTMAYTIAYSWNTMWMDGFMILPLAVLGLERLLKERKFKLYIFSLAYAILTNYYIAMMICIFLVLYFIGYLIREKATFKQDVRSFFEFGICSVVAAGIVAVIAIPTYLSMGATYAGTGGDLPETSNLYTMVKFFARSLYKVAPTVRSQTDGVKNLPNIFCGIMTLVTVPMYLSMKTIPAKRKIANVFIWLVIGISLVINAPNLLWHGLHTPSDLPYRYSFLYSFILLLMSAEVIAKIKDVQPKQIALSVTGIIAFLVFAETQSDLDLSFSTLYGTALFVFVYGIVFFIASRKGVKEGVSFTLILIVVFYETVLNLGTESVQLRKQESHSGHYSYIDNAVVSGAQAAADEMTRLVGDDFYRVEFLPHKTTCDPSLLNYRGISLFASTMPEFEENALKALGYESNGVNSHINRSFNPISDSILGLKYIAFKNDSSSKFESAPGESYNSPFLRYVTTTSVEDVKTTGSGTEIMKYNIFENVNALPIAFVAKGNLRTTINDNGKEEGFVYVDYNENGKPVNPPRPFEDILALMRALTGTRCDGLLTQIAPTHTSGSGSIGGSRVSAFNTGGSGTNIYTVTAEKEGQILVAVDCGAAKSINIKTEHQSYSTGNKIYVINCGNMQPGEEVTVTIESSSSVSGNIYAYYLDETIMNNTFDELKKGGITLSDFGDTYIKGTVTNNTDQTQAVFASIPYDEGWSVKVDGKKVETYMGAKAFLCFDIEPGEHTVEYSFFTKGLGLGILVEIIALALLAYIILDQRYRQGKSHPKFLAPVFKKLSLDDSVIEPDLAKKAPEAVTETGPAEAPAAEDAPGDTAESAAEDAEDNREENGSGEGGTAPAEESADSQTDVKND
ncbi:MAG: YfhO family protein [Clostridia bacterium]|nr:YfhO family protein [Clostridia bacterium]